MGDFCVTVNGKLVVTEKNALPPGKKPVPLYAVVDLIGKVSGASILFAESKIFSDLLAAGAANKCAGSDRACPTGALVRLRWQPTGL